MEFINKTMICQGKLCPSGKSVFESGRVIYEVLRIIDGVPIFFEKHYKRLENSAKLIHHSLHLNQNQFEKWTLDLMYANSVYTGNIKWNVGINPQGEEFVELGFIPHHYPDEATCRQGVTVITLDAVRTNPNAKVIQQDLRDQCNKIITSGKAYEVALVSPDGSITEGSRSNLFFIKNNILFTAPEKEVLAGITRDMVINLAGDLSVKTIDTPVNIRELAQMDAAFITGTSPKVLQICRCNEFNYSLDHPVFRKLSGQYELLIRNYMNAYQKKPNIQE